MAMQTVALTLDPPALRALDRIRREYFLDSASAAVRLALGREAGRIGSERQEEAEESFSW